jgi:hypothetical protein
MVVVHSLQNCIDTFHSDTALISSGTIAPARIVQLYSIDRAPRVVVARTTD